MPFNRVLGVYSGVAMSASKIVFLSIFLVLAISLVLPLRPQTKDTSIQPSQEKPSVSTGVQAASQNDAVTLFITVTDKKGQPATDLTKANMHVFEDTMEQVVDSFQYDTSTAVFLGVLIDISGSSRDEKGREKKLGALSDFLHTGLRNQDAGFIIAFRDEGFLLTDLTNSRQDFDQALSKIERYQPHGSTSLYDSIYAAADADFHGRSGRRALLILSDF